MAIIYCKTNEGFKSIDLDPHSPILQPNEEIAWELIQDRGIISKKTVKFWITNYRIIVYDVTYSTVLGLLLLQELDDCVVMNVNRIHQSDWVGGNVSIFRGVGATAGTSQGKSVQLGDILFMSQGKPVIIWRQVADPFGLRRLVLSIRKQCYPKKELVRFLSGIRSDGLPLRSLCSGCGNENQIGSSFCSRCGHILK